VRAVVHAASAQATQTNVPAVVCAPASSIDELVHSWAHAVVLGPGLGRDEEARATMARVLAACRRASELRVVTTVRARGSVAVGASARRPPALVLDADALMLLSSPSGVDTLRALGERSAVLLTPHAGECAVLADACGVAFDPQWRDPTARAAAARGMARATGCTVLLKGAPTVCASPEGAVWFVPRGSAALATGGTGDVLAGVLAAILASAHGADAPDTPVVAHAALGAWVHGVAGECVSGPRVVRGTTVDDVVHALGAAWAQLAAPVPLAPGVLAEVPPSRS